MSFWLGFGVGFIIGQIVLTIIALNVNISTINFTLDDEEEEDE